MSGKITRRTALALGAVSTGILMGTGPACEKQNVSSVSDGYVWIENTWSRGPNKNLVRDLTPGPHTYVLPAVPGQPVCGIPKTKV